MLLNGGVPLLTGIAQCHKYVTMVLYSGPADVQTSGILFASGSHHVHVEMERRKT